MHTHIHIEASGRVCLLFSTRQSLFPPTADEYSPFAQSNLIHNDHITFVFINRPTLLLAMRSFGVLATLVACFAASASSQQYAGEVIDTSLPNVPGSEIAFFKIPGVMDSNKKKAANLTLINYISHGSDGKRLVESKVQRAVIIIHGLNRDPGTYESNMLSALAQVNGDPNISKDSVAVMAPYFANGKYKSDMIFTTRHTDLQCRR
jgi:hypothetical protein